MTDAPPATADVLPARAGTPVVTPASTDVLPAHAGTLTMDRVFADLCAVLRAGLEDLQDHARVDALAMNYADGNTILAWQQLVLLLGVYYGKPIFLV